MSKKLFIGNISFSVTDDKLREIFSASGTVESAKVVIDRQTGRSKGFGFVEMSSEDEARAAIEAHNGQDVDGRSITVAEARPQTDRPQGGGGFRGGGGGGGNRRGGGGGGGFRGGNGGGGGRRGDRSGGGGFRGRD